MDEGDAMDLGYQKHLQREMLDAADMARRIAQCPCCSGTGRQEAWDVLSPVCAFCYGDGQMVTKQEVKK